MNTKIKILTSTLSIAVVVGLMGYGVFASQTPTMGTTNGVIGFNAVSVYARVSNEKTNAVGTSLSSNSQQNYTDIKKASYDFTAWNIGDMNFDETDNKSFSYTTTIINDSDFDITVGFKFTGSIQDADAFTISSSINNNGSTNIAKGANKQFTIVIELNDVSKTLTGNNTFGFEYTLAKKSA